MTRIISRELLLAKNIQRRKAMVESSNKLDPRTREYMLSELENGKIPKIQTPRGLDLRQVLNIEAAQNLNDGEGAVKAYPMRESALGTGDFSNKWVERQRYEIDAGRESEPILFDSIYDVTVDPTLPKTIDVTTLGDAGVIFEEVVEGQEVRYASVSEGAKSISMRHFATGLSYTEDIFIYNELWRLPNLERQFGIAYNALLNHMHMHPILSATYTGNNATDGTALTSFLKAAEMPEKYLRTVEAAITASSDDTTNPRRGPYALIVASGDKYTVQRALKLVSQEGFDRQSDAIGEVQAVVVYNGWSGQRGKKAVSYPGVTSGKAYLVNLGNRQMDFQSYFKQQLRQQQIAGDMSRFIMERVLFDTRFGLYAAPTRSVQEITWPGVNSGATPS